MRTAQKTTTQEVLILKSKSQGETDRIMTLVSCERGRFMATAKGVRKITSTQKSALESGNVARAFLIETHRSGDQKSASWPLVTQATLISDCQLIRSNLIKIRQLIQFLEVLDRLLVEEELETELWQEIILIRQLIVGVADSDPARNGLIKQKLETLINHLGYQPPPEEKYQSVLDYVADITGQPMRSWDYLDPDNRRLLKKRG